MATTIDSGRFPALLARGWLMMPSMAVSDGNPLEQAPPTDSACPELHLRTDAGPTP